MWMYFCGAAGLQVFHCIRYGKGGKSFFVDGLGWNVIQELQYEDPESLDILSKMNVPAEYIDKDKHHKYSAPIIQFDSITEQPKQIRFDLYDHCGFNRNELNTVKKICKSLKKLTEIVNDDNNIIEFRLKAGRDEYSGECVMTSYVSTNFMSKARTFGLIK